MAPATPITVPITPVTAPIMAPASSLSVASSSRAQSAPGGRTSPAVAMAVGRLQSMVGGCLGPSEKGALARVPCETAPTAIYDTSTHLLSFEVRFAFVAAFKPGERVTMQGTNPTQWELYDYFSGSGGGDPNPQFAHSIRVKGAETEGGVPLCLDAAEDEVVLKECQRLREAQTVRFVRSQ